MHRSVITARLREGSAEKVAQILREGPPFDIAETSLERHAVFLSEGEVVFLFEGTHAEEEARRLMVSRSVTARVGRSAITSMEGPACPGRSSAGSVHRNSTV